MCEFCVVQILKSASQLATNGFRSKRYLVLLFDFSTIAILANEIQKLKLNKHKNPIQIGQCNRFY